MIWDKPSISRIFFILVVIIYSSGCASIVHGLTSDYKSAVDLSDSDTQDVAIIRGADATTMPGFISDHCWIRSPGQAKQVTVNAGVIDITAACEGFDFSGSSGGTNMHFLSFHFDALAGHEYTIKRRRGHFRVRDMTAKQNLEHCTQSSTDACYTSAAASNSAARAEMEEALTPGRIKSAQQMLNLLGYECGEPTGVVDGRTRTAVIDYQFDQKLEITGWIDDSLVTHLETQVANR